MQAQRKKINEIKAVLQCCSFVGLETSCSDCLYRYRCNALAKDALNIITEQEKDIEQLTEKYNRCAEKLTQLYNFICANGKGVI